ncbi:MAG: carboxypeptidase regulatory-like domain-containing protein, partial [Acidobacteriota bacterium]
MAWMMMLAPVAAPAQVITGTILGTVSDPSGAPVKSAKVRIVNTGTNVATETTANELGEYVAPYLPTGMYEVTIESTGFKKFRSTGITLTLDSKVRVDASLVLGAVQETVEVRADALALQTDSTDLNSTVSKNMIASVPNIGRSPTYYMATIPGVVPRGSFEGTGNFATGDGARAQFSNFTVNGSRPISTEVLLDGAPNTGAAFNEIITVPNLDAIGEMKVITNAYSAEYGRASGGVISFGTKSGTNEFHGAVYDYWRNSALNANDFGRNSFGRNAAGNPVREKGVFNIHQFGANLAGPVRLPKYDGRNKTFFFFAYEGNRRVEDASAFLTVPTQRERNGDFSQTFAQFRNPATGQIELTPRLIFNPTPGGSTVTEVAAGQFRINRAPFLGNVIPASMINATGRTLVSSYPLPNITPLNVDGTLNYFDSNVIRTQTDQFIFKLDQQFNERHRTFFRWTTDWTLNTPPDRFRGEGGNRAATQQSLTRQFIPTLTVGHTWTKSATSLFEFRMNVNRLSLINEPPQGVNTDLNALGFAPDMIRVLQNNPFPFVVPGGGFPEIGFRFFQLQRNFSTNSAFVVNYTKIRGKWTHKVGGEYRPMLNTFTQPRVPGLIFRADENGPRVCTGPGCPALP